MNDYGKRVLAVSCLANSLARLLRLHGPSRCEMLFDTRQALISRTPRRGLHGGPGSTRMKFVPVRTRPLAPPGARVMVAEPL